MPGLIIRSGIAEDALDFFLGLPEALLNAPDQFVFLAFIVTKVIVRQIAEFLFQFALGNVPVALYFEFVHKLC
jgi:hypothetical protein